MPRSFFTRRVDPSLRFLGRKPSLVTCTVVTLVSAVLSAPAMAAGKVQLSVDVSKAGAKIDRNIFGQFAEHLGHGIYEGIWVGPGSTIPNRRGVRNDVVAAALPMNTTGATASARSGR